MYKGKNRMCKNGQEPSTSCMCYRIFRILSVMPQLPEHLGVTNLTHFCHFLCVFTKKNLRATAQYLSLPADVDSDSWVGRKLAKISSSSLTGRYAILYKIKIHGYMLVQFSF
jgi:hypothetical protein